MSFWPWAFAWWAIQPKSTHIKKSLAVNYSAIISQPFPFSQNMNVNHQPLVLVGIWLCFSANYDWSTDTCTYVVYM